MPAVLWLFCSEEAINKNEIKFYKGNNFMTLSAMNLQKIYKKCFAYIY